MEEGEAEAEEEEEEGGVTTASCQLGSEAGKGLTDENLDRSSLQRSM